MYHLYNAQRLFYRLYPVNLFFFFAVNLNYNITIDIGINFDNFVNESVFTKISKGKKTYRPKMTWSCFQLKINWIKLSDDNFFETSLKYLTKHETNSKIKKKSLQQHWVIIKDEKKEIKQNHETSMFDT